MSRDCNISLEKQLFDACCDGQMDVIDSLLEAGVDVNVPFTGKLPLHWACRQTEPWTIDVVTKLLIHGADVDLEDENEWNALDYVMCNYYFQPDVAQLLLDCSKKGFAKFSSEYIICLREYAPESIKFLNKNGFDTNCVANGSEL